MKYKIPQLIPFLGNEELANLEIVIKNKWLTEGPFSEEFLSIIKDFTGAKYAVLANNGTLALFLALKAIGINPGDEVIVPDFTFIASATSIVFSGGVPLFTDVDYNNLNINVDEIEKKITKQTKAIMPVHVYGQSANMEPIVNLATKYKLKIVEDAAQGFGVFYKNKHVGTIGDIGIISFFADKTITTGEGAVILTNKEEIYNNLKYLRNQGRLNSGSFIHPYLGMNFRMTDLQCAIGVAQIKKFNEIKKIKLINYNIYKDKLNNIDEIDFVKEEEYSNLVPFRVNIRVEFLEKLIEYLENNGIQTRKFFYPLHRQPCFQYLNYNIHDFPITNKLNEVGLSLPIYPDLKEIEINYICDKIRTFYKNENRS